MRMKPKTYNKNFLIANSLQLTFLVAKYLHLRSLSHVFSLILTFVNYINK